MKSAASFLGLMLLVNAWGGAPGTLFPRKAEPLPPGKSKSLSYPRHELKQPRPQANPLPHLRLQRTFKNSA